jgi:aminopeptidase N
MDTVERLIDYFVPDHYDLRLTINEKAHTFEGTVTIKGMTTGDDRAVKLHAKELTIVRATIDDKPAKFVAGKHDELALTVDKLQAGEHTVTVSFSGEITDPMHGLYPSYYRHDGVKKELFATQFESHHSREVFPSIDEPAAKATFDVTLTTTAGQTVLSNMPMKHQDEKDGSLVTSFQTSPRMSTYLLAFVIGDMQKKSAQTKNGVEVSIWSTVAQPAANLDYALTHAVNTVEFYEEYFDTPYPLPKSDHVALPDFSSGAMENWGLITYRELALLADPKKSSIDHRRHVAKVVSHELAHMWFGNLVTMAWWNDLWLNESFANMMEYLSVDALYPEWNTWLEFDAHETVMALRRDSLDGVQSVQVEVHHPDEIGSLFDPAIVYAKGGRLMRMIQHYVGDDAFRVGLKQYFTDHAYKNTVGNDLWDALEKASGKKVTTIMNAWISQPGFPVVNITRDGENVSLSQERFFIGPHNPSDSLWPIPLDAAADGAPKLFDNPKISWPSKDPIRLNSADTSHFITNYDDMSRKHLIGKVADGTLDTVGRIQLLHESTLLTRAGLMSTDQLIPLIQAYKDESLESVWDMISLSLAELRKFVELDKDAEAKLRQFCAWIAKKQYDRLGWQAKEGESEDDTKLRTTVIALTLYGEVPEALEKAKQLYETQPTEKLDAELRPLILSSVARYGDGKVVDDMLEAYKRSQDSELKLDICVGATSTRIPEKISLMLDSMKDVDTIKPQDVFYWFVHLVRGKESRELAWQWIRDNWDWVEKAFAGDKSYDDFPRYSSGALTTRKQLEQYKEFFEPKKNIPALTRVITLGIGEIEGRVELIERDKGAVIAALKALKLA